MTGATAGEIPNLLSPSLPSNMKHWRHRFIAGGVLQLKPAGNRVLLSGREKLSHRFRWKGFFLQDLSSFLSKNCVSCLPSESFKILCNWNETWYSSVLGLPTMWSSWYETTQSSTRDLFLLWHRCEEFQPSLRPYLFRKLHSSRYDDF